MVPIPPLADLLGPGGALARALPSYEPRASQLEMAEAVSSALERGRALAVEAGIQPSSLPWKPWLRIGFDMGSGDDDAGDGHHESFFQMLPTARQYSLSTFYNLMNSEDAFAHVILRPIAGLVWRTDFHLLRLSEDDDLWYFGGGATRERRNVAFGYGGRPSGGKSSLMEILETQFSYNWNDFVSTTAYYGHGFGEGVVKADFRANDANYGFLEVTLKLPPM